MNYETFNEVASTLFFLGFLIFSVREKELGYKALYLGWAAIALLAKIADKV